MRTNIQYRWLAPIALLCVLLSEGCKQRPERPQLPAEAPKTPTLEFTGPEQGWPPRPKNITNLKEVPWQPIPSSMSDSLEAALRQTAAQDARVRDLLSTRYAYIGADEVERDKEAAVDTAGARSYRVTFFSYTRNAAVEATVQSSKVMDARIVEGYQPREGAEEVRQAIALAKRDSRLRGKLEGLEAAALLVYQPEGMRGTGHRILHVTFTKTNEDFPSYSAMVDLTDQKVLTAGSEQ